jgi:hypothetical protein
MQKIRYSPDVDAFVIQVSDQPTFYAENNGQVILHSSEADQLVPIEILDLQRYLTQASTLHQTA